MITDQQNLSFKRAAYNIGNTSDLTSNWTEVLQLNSGGNFRLGLDSITTRTDSAHYGLNITGKSGTTGAGSIYFIDAADNCDGSIACDDGVMMITADTSDNTASSMIKMRVDGSNEVMRINNDQSVRIGDSCHSNAASRLQVVHESGGQGHNDCCCLLYTSPSPRDS